MWPWFGVVSFLAWHSRLAQAAGSNGRQARNGMLHMHNIFMLDVRHAYARIDRGASLSCTARRLCVRGACAPEGGGRGGRADAPTLTWPFAIATRPLAAHRCEKAGGAMRRAAKPMARIRAGCRQHLVERGGGGSGSLQPTLSHARCAHRLKRGHSPGISSRTSKWVWPGALESGMRRPLMLVQLFPSPTSEALGNLQGTLPPNPDSRHFKPPASSLSPLSLSLMTSSIFLVTRSPVALAAESNQTRCPPACFCILQCVWPVLEPSAVRRCPLPFHPIAPS
eukprot:6184813-Pleurochrysis_carterae.AAC.1